MQVKGDPDTTLAHMKQEKKKEEAAVFCRVTALRLKAGASFLHHGSHNSKENLDDFVGGGIENHSFFPFLQELFKRQRRGGEKGRVRCKSHTVQTCVGGRMWINKTVREKDAATAVSRWV